MTISFNFLRDFIAQMFGIHRIISSVNFNLHLIKRNLITTSVLLQRETNNNFNRNFGLSIDNIDFKNSKFAYKSKTISQLIRSYLIFSLCSFNTIVENQGYVCHLFDLRLKQNCFYFTY